MTIYKVRVNYKSGISEEFWCTKFEINGNSMSWEAYMIGEYKNAIDISHTTNSIESIWQVDMKEVDDIKEEKS